VGFCALEIKSEPTTLQSVENRRLANFEGVHDVGSNYSDCRPAPAIARRPPHLAVQQRMGLLSQRRTGPDSLDPHRARPILTAADVLDLAKNVRAPGYEHEQRGLQRQANDQYPMRDGKEITALQHVDVGRCYGDS
jgi:hypothetical protein